MKRFIRLAAVLMALLLCITSVQPIVTSAKTTKTAAAKKKIKLNKTKVTIRVTRTLQLKLKNAKTKKVKWSTSNKKVATVKRGLVTAKRAGKATITAKYKGKKYKAKITVKKLPTGVIVPKAPTDYNTLNEGQKMLDDMYQGKNIIVSPTSLNMVLGMASNGATEQVNKEIESFINISPATYTDVNAPALMEEAKNEDMLSVNNGVWYKTGYTLNATFKQAVEEKYLAEVKDAAMNNDTKDEINQWVSDKTDDMIKKIIDEIDPLVRAILVNAILFDGKWTYPFDASDTFKKDFTTFAGTKSKVDMMSGKVKYYYENDKAIGFEKEYGKNKQFSMIAILPKKTGEFKISDLGLESFLNSRTNQYYVNIQMPKFSYEWNDDGMLNQSLQKNGVTTIFNDTLNPLGNIFGELPPGEGIYASDINQSCKIIVDEEGTKAAAVTSLIAKATSMPMMDNVKNVNLDRPFAYIIMDNTTGEVLFVGKVVTIEK